MQYGRLPQLQKQLEEEEDKVKAEGAKSLVHEAVTEEEIAKNHIQMDRNSGGQAE